MNRRHPGKKKIFVGYEFSGEFVYAFANEVTSGEVVTTAILIRGLVNDAPLSITETSSTSCGDEEIPVMLSG